MMAIVLPGCMWVEVELRQIAKTGATREALATVPGDGLVTAKDNHHQFPESSRFLVRNNFCGGRDPESAGMLLRS